MDMKVVTLALLVALLTATLTVTAVKMKKHKSNRRKDYGCFATFLELEQSLLRRKSNIDRLHRAFFANDQHFPVAVDLLVHFSTSLQHTSQELSYPSTIIRLDNDAYDYKFRWYDSRVLLFLQPEMLRPLSLFVYQGVVTTAEVVIDPICDTETKQTRMYKGIRKRIDDGIAKQLLNSLCIHLQSYVLNRAAKVNKELTGYCSYYFTYTELHILDHYIEDVVQRIFLIIAVFSLCLIIAICVPLAMYSEVLFPLESEESEPNETDESMLVVKLARQMLIKIKTSYVYYVFAFFTIAPFLDIGILGLNVWLLVQCKLTWYIAFFVAAFIVLLAIDVTCITVMTCIRWDRLKTNMSDNCCFVILYGLGGISVVIAVQFLTFHIVIILLAFTSSPLPTTAFTLIYISAFFSLLGAVSIWIKVLHKCAKNYLLQAAAVTLSSVCVLSFDALFFVTLMRAQIHHNPFGVVAFFGALVPAAVLAFLTFLGNKMISMVSEKTRDGYTEISE